MYYNKYKLSKLKKEMFLKFVNNFSLIYKTIKKIYFLNFHIILKIILYNIKIYKYY